MHFDRLRQLAVLLNEYEDLWRQRPFVQIPVPWEKDWTALSSALRSLNREDILKYESSPLSIPVVRESIDTLASDLENLTQWSPIADRGTATLDKLSPPKRVRKRKWEQAVSLVSVLERFPPKGVARYVDWCSGKGHLARALAQTIELPITCVEKNPMLCTSGRREAELADVSIDFVCCDVLDEIPDGILDGETGVVALHACGHLNTTLIERAVAEHVPFLAIAPCCYQRIDGMTYRPLSEEANIHNVDLTRHQLRLPSLDETMTSDDKRAVRRREHAFRLGVDLLQRQASGQDAYCPLGQVKARWLKRDFAFFAKKVAKSKGISFPNDVDWKKAESAGWERFYLASALGMARGIFRRAIESWLILDRASFLESNGYIVHVGTFCSQRMTPRNLMIVAHT